MREFWKTRPNAEIPESRAIHIDIRIMRKLKGEIIMSTNNIIEYVRTLARNYMNRGIFCFTVNGCEMSIEWVSPRQYAIMCTPRNGGNPFNAGYIFA